MMFKKVPNTPKRTQPRVDVYDYLEGTSLTQKASSILFLLSELPYLSPPQDIASFREKLIKQLRVFERAVKQSPHHGLLDEAHYVLCSVVDEAILNSSWDTVQNYWRSHGTTREFSYDRLGGEKFFTILNEARQDPLHNIDLLELMFVCLSLGFRGKYQLEPKGAEWVENIHQELFRIISQYRYAEQVELFPICLSLICKPEKKRLNILIMLFIVAMMISCFASLKTQLNNEVQPLIDQLNSIGASPVSISPMYEPEVQN